MKDFDMKKLQPGFHGAFESKRGVTWNYIIFPEGDVEQWHNTTVRCTGGWRSGPDVYARRITKECFDAIDIQFGFKRDPEHDHYVLCTDLSQDKIIAEFQNNYKDLVSVNLSPQGTLRLISITYDQIGRITTIASVEEAEEILKRRFGHWERTY